MTVPRSKLIDLSVTRFYHTISRCVRRSHLLSEGEETGSGHRKAWIENRLKELADIFSISVGGFAILDNHFHLLLRLDPETLEKWTSEEIVSRWFRLYPPKGTDRKPLPPAKLKELFDQRLKDKDWIAKMRNRLGSISWFMKCLKEPLSRMVNKAEGCSGAFFEGRFKSIAILDEEALLSVAAYIDLNPVAAGMAAVPEESDHTSIKARVENVGRQDRLKDLEAARLGSVPASKVSAFLEDSLWLIPIEDRRRIDSVREGLIEGFTLGNYLALVDYTGRLLREGKASIPPEIAGIFERLGSSSELWQARMQRLASGRWMGRFLATSRERLREVAEKLGVQRIANLDGCAA